MTTNEAFEFTLEKVDELKELGIKVKIKPYNFIDDKHRKEIIEEYNGPDSAIPDKWVGIRFISLTETQAEKVYEMTNYLLMCGIGFVTGGCSGCYDWELDWSFHYTGKEDEDAREGTEWVQDQLRDWKNKEK